MKLTFETLCARIKRQGGEPRSYSGRGMYGHRCVGVDMDYEEQYELPRGYSMDSMGMGVIAYWPSVEWKEGDEE